MPAEKTIAPSREVRDKIADFVMDWMADNAPSLSIDALLTWPDKSQRMAQWVCRRLGRPATALNVHIVCRAALNARKHGGMKRDKY